MYLNLKHFRRVNRYFATLPMYYFYFITAPLSRDGSFGPSPVSGGAPSPPLMMEPPGRPPSANPRDGSRGELSKQSF